MIGMFKPAIEYIILSTLQMPIGTLNLISEFVSCHYVNSKV